VIFSVIAFNGLSVRARKINAGPSVINVYSREGGYFVTFKNDNKLNTLFFCWDQRAASPYQLPDRNKIKRAIAANPIERRNFFFCRDQNSEHINYPNNILNP
jgi:hypothetical protein